MDAAKLASRFLPRNGRIAVYLVYGVIGFALGTWATWLTATGQLAPTVLVGLVAVYGYAGPFVVGLAGANLTSKPTGEDERR